MNSNFKALKLIMISLIMIISLASCGYTNTDNNNNNTIGVTKNNIVYNTNNVSSISSFDYSDNDTLEDVQTDEITESTTADKSEYSEKLIYKCSIEIETIDFDKSYNEIKDLITKYNCFLESETFKNMNSLANEYSYINGKSSELIIRVPVENYEQIIDDYGAIGNVLYKTQTVENITYEYYDTTSQVNGLKKQLSRLEKMLEETDVVSEMIEINKEITSLEYRISTLNNNIKTMDMDVAYSYITINLNEVAEYSETETPVKTNTFFDRLKNQIKNTFSNFLLFLENILFLIIALLPYGLIIGLIAFVVYKIHNSKYAKNKRLRRKSKERRKDIKGLSIENLDNDNGSLKEKKNGKGN